MARAIPVSPTPSLFPALLLCLLLALSLNPKSEALRRVGGSLSLGAVKSAPLKVTRVRGYKSQALLPGSLATLQQTPGEAQATTGAKAVGRDSVIQWPAATSGPVKYQGGPLMTAPITVHLIFYGHWPQGSGQEVLSGFVESISSSSADSQGPSVHKWWRILAPYVDSNGEGVSMSVTTGKTVAIGGNYRKQLGDGQSGGTNDIENIVVKQIESGNLPLDESAFYAVITSGDVHIGDSTTGFCGTQGYCGWHTSASASGGATIRYALIGDGTQQCNNGCGQSAGYDATANGKYAIDSLISTFAHELAEAASDPDGNSGYLSLDQNGQTEWENADLCNSQYTDSAHPELLTDAAGTYAYNLVGVSQLKFLVQTNVDLKRQECVLQGTGSAATAGSPPPPPDVVSASPPPPSPPPADSASPPPPSPPAVAGPPPPPSPTLVIAPGPATEGFIYSPSSAYGESVPPSAPYTDVWAEPPAVQAPDSSGGGIGAVPPSDGSCGGGSGHGGEADPECFGNNFGFCGACSSSDGCRCFHGACLDVCQVAALGNYEDTCSTCGSDSCYCGPRGTCETAESFWEKIHRVFGKHF